MIDIVFVDDEIDLARDLAEYFGEALGVSCLALSDSVKVLETVREQGVKIAVLDQQMPVPGIELGQRIATEDNRVLRILLSGEATAAQVTAANRMGFDEHVHKNDVLDELPLVLRRLLLKYDRALATPSERALLLPAIYLGRWPRRKKIILEFLRIEDTDHEFVFPDSWITQGKVDAGQTVEEGVDLTWERNDQLRLEATDTTALSAKLGARVGSARAETAIKREVASKASVQSDVKRTEKITIKRTLTLAPEPTDPAATYCTAKSYQAAPVYTKVVVALRATCSCCGHAELLKANYFISRRKHATRQVKYWSDNSPMTILWTGVETD